MSGVSCFGLLREEFRLQKLGFGGAHPDCFYTFLWRPPKLLYLLYRFVMAAYTLSFLIYTASGFHSPPAPYPWPSYLTNWSYTMLTLYMVTHFIITLTVFVYRAIKGISLVSLLSRMDNDEHRKCIQISANQNPVLYEDAEERHLTASDTFVIIHPLPFYTKILWVLFSIVSVAALIVTSVFWITIFPTLGPVKALGMDNLQLHILNTVIVLIEHSVSAIPVRLLHVIYPFIYGLIYIIFSAIYWAGNHKRVIYPILDWNAGGITFGYVLVIGFVIVPAIHLLFFGIYHLKLFLFKKCTYSL